MTYWVKDLIRCKKSHLLWNGREFSYLSNSCTAILKNHIQLGLQVFSSLLQKHAYLMKWMNMKCGALTWLWPPPGHCRGPAGCAVCQGSSSRRSWSGSATWWCSCWITSQSQYISSPGMPHVVIYGKNCWDISPFDTIVTVSVLWQDIFWCYFGLARISK